MFDTSSSLNKEETWAIQEAREELRLWNSIVDEAQRITELPTLIDDNYDRSTTNPEEKRRIQKRNRSSESIIDLRFHKTTGENNRSNNWTRQPEKLDTQHMSL
ncbi:hypothetical protein U1Q18_012785 [Sarracenia purpurea var. burkii]